MANPVSPNDGNGFRLGYGVHKVGTTLTAVILRMIAKASTSGASDVGWAGFGTHVEDEPAVVADASATPLVLIGGKRGSHVTVSAAGDVGALQVDTHGNLMTARVRDSAWDVGNVTVNGTAGRVDNIRGQGAGASVLTGRKAVTLRSKASNTVTIFVGPNSSVDDTGANIGGELIPGASMTFEFGANLTIYAITAGTSATLEVYQEA